MKKITKILTISLLGIFCTLSISGCKKDINAEKFYNVLYNAGEHYYENEFYDKYSDKTLVANTTSRETYDEEFTYKKNIDDVDTVTEYKKVTVTSEVEQSFQRTGKGDNTIIKINKVTKNTSTGYKVNLNNYLLEPDNTSSKHIETYYFGKESGATSNYYGLKIVNAYYNNELSINDSYAYKMQYSSIDDFRDDIETIVSDFNSEWIEDNNFGISSTTSLMLGDLISYYKDGNKVIAEINLKNNVNVSDTSISKGGSTSKIIFKNNKVYGSSYVYSYNVQDFEDGAQSSHNMTSSVVVGYTSDYISLPIIDTNYVSRSFSIDDIAISISMVL